MSIVHGSTGITYFVHEWDADGNFVSEFALLNDHELAPAVTEVNAELTELASVINSDTLEGKHTTEILQGASSDDISTDYGIDPVASMLKKQDGEYYLFAVRMREDPAQAAFVFDGLFEGGQWQAHVLGEDRVIDIIDGTLVDDFAGYDTHLYHIVPEPGSAALLGLASIALLRRKRWRR